MRWRETMRPARFLMFDARSVFILLFLIFVQSWFVFIICSILIIFLYAVEQRGLTVPAALRRVRRFIAGERRPSISIVKYRRMVDYHGDWPIAGRGSLAKLSPKDKKTKKKTKKSKGALARRI